MPEIINLSHLKLTDAQVKLLGKGLKYTPTPNKDSTGLASDVKDFGRKIKLREYFYNENEQVSSTKNNVIFKNKGTFNPPRGRDKTFDIAIDSLHTLADNLTKEDNNNARKSNLTKEEWDALSSLRNNMDIVIKEADKGNAVVIMDSEYYENKIMSMLSDEETYEESERDNSKKVVNEVHSLMKKAKLSKDICDFTTRFEIKASNFYGLPKIHKSKEIQNAIEKQKSSYVEIICPTDLTFPPIVAGPSCATHRLSKLIDSLLKPYTKYVKSYIRDDIDFLNKIPRNTSNNGLLATFDVVSLYTNIDHNLGIEAVAYWINKHPSLLPDEYDISFILEAVELILNNNLFKFNNKHFSQKRGTAMGTQMAPTYATLTMGYLEEMLYKTLEETKGTEYSKYIQDNWKRFLDDCFLYWPNYLGSIDNFKAILNNLHPQIQFTLNISETEIPFLDILVLNGENGIETDIYYKGTDSHNYVPFTSCHPHHTKINIPYSLARRICTIVDQQEKVELRLQEMKFFLQRKGYPMNVIDNAIQKAMEHDKNDLRNPQPKAQTVDSSIALVTTHNPNNPRIHKGIQTALSILNNSKTMNPIMANTRIINSKRQPPNLKKLLTTAKFSTKQCTPTVSKCADTRCKCCDHVENTTTVTMENGETFYVKTDMNCNTSNLIYMLQCCGCKQQYIGETGDTLRNRMRVHRQHVRDENVRMLYVSEHIDKCAKQKPFFKVFPFYKCTNTSTVFRREKEKYFINKYKPSLNM